MKTTIKLTLIILILAFNVEAQGYKDPNVAIYEAMRPMLEGNNYVPPQRIIIQQERIIPQYENVPPRYNPQDLQKAEKNLKETLEKTNQIPFQYDFLK